MIRKPRERRYLHNIHIIWSDLISIKYWTLREKSFSVCGVGVPHPHHTLSPAISVEIIFKLKF
mgnify:FL=1